MSSQGKFMIHYADAFYSYELYNSKGEEIFTLEEAIEEAKRQFPEEVWEVYNGEEAYSNG